jgi:hypothetical protein
MANDEVRQLARQFKGLWIPAAILNQNMNAICKMLWADIDSFSGNGATWFKSRDRAADEMGVHKVTISRALTTLRDLELVQVVKNDGRVIHYVSHLPQQNDTADESNDVRQPQQVATIDNKRETQRRTQKRMAPPSIDEVQAYFAERGCIDGEEPEKFRDYYTANGWTQGRAGKPIKDWKAAARNWMKNVKQFSTTKKGFRAENFSPDSLGNFIANG